jgi:hypothetical protein
VHAGKVLTEKQRNRRVLELELGGEVQIDQRGRFPRESSYSSAHAIPAGSRRSRARVTAT